METKLESIPFKQCNFCDDPKGNIFEVMKSLKKSGLCVRICTHCINNLVEQARLIDKRIK